MTPPRPIAAGRQVLLLAVILLPLLLAGWAFTRYQAESAPTSDRSRQSRPKPVVTTVATARPVAEELEAFGSLQAFRSISITNETDGRVTRISFSGGQQVEAGEVLLTLDSALQQAGVDEAQAQLLEMEIEVERALQLQRQQLGSQQIVDSLRARRASARAELARNSVLLQQRTLTAEFSGVTGMPLVAVGEYIDSSTLVTTLDALQTMRVDFDLPESAYPEVAEGQPVIIAATALPDRQFAGEISEIDSRIDTASGTFRVRALLPNPERVLRAGMFVSVRLQLGERQTLLIPEEALVPRGVRNFVATVQDDTASLHEVTIGRRIDGMVEIVTGVEPGAIVVTRGHAGLKSGSRVTIQDTDNTATSQGSASGKATPNQ